MDSYSIEPTYGHFEVYINGEFYCTADSVNEATREIEDYKKEHALVN